MTLLGKILTVLIFIMSIVFMSLSLMVFATHKNWKLVVTNETPGSLGLVQQLNNRTNQVENLKNEIGRLKDQYAAEQVARAYALSALSTKLTQLEQQLQQRETELTNLQGAHTEQTAALQTIETNNNRLLEEVAKLRDSVRVAQNDRDSQFLKVVELTDQLNSAIGVERSLKEKREQLVEQVAQMKRVMDANGLTINVDTDAIPPKVDGVVLAIGGKDLLEISLGSDSGLKEGHEMEVYRGATYLGRVIVVKAEPNRAVARILPEYRKGSIKKDDRVTTRLG